MRYLDKSDLMLMNHDFLTHISVIKKTLKAKVEQETIQPIKPYLKLGNSNRIIAMPAYVGSDANIAGIKWIASFPENISRGIERAQSVTILNDANSGIVKCIINSSEISSIRTAAVSGMFLQRALKNKAFSDKLRIGIIGYGPVAKMHVKMLKDLLKPINYEIHICDKNRTTLIDNGDLIVHKSYDHFFGQSDVIITCTNTSEPHINLNPKVGSIHLNISLRDYSQDFYKKVDTIIVDDWDEVCRERTDVHRLAEENLLTKGDVVSFEDFILGNHVIQSKEVMSFNPMGLAIFDIAIAANFYKNAVLRDIGTIL